MNLVKSLNNVFAGVFAAIFSVFIIMVVMYLMKQAFVHRWEVPILSHLTREVV